MERILILHNIRSAENVGSMFRTADAFGVTNVYLTGYTPAPVDRFNRPVSKIAKTALGAERSVLWARGEIHKILADLKEQNVRVIMLEQDPRAIDLPRAAQGLGSVPVALVVGNEVAGIEPEVLALADAVIEIPMRGTKESLNVAVAAGIALYALTACDPGP